MAHYSQTRDQVLETPIATFWMLYAAIERMEAAEDLRRVTTGMFAQPMGKDGQERFNEYVDALNARAGQAAIYQDVLDRQGLAELKRLASGARR